VRHGKANWARTRTTAERPSPTPGGRPLQRPLTQGGGEPAAVRPRGSSHETGFPGSPPGRRHLQRPRGHMPSPHW
jgi:hypothetical protein